LSIFWIFCRYSPLPPFGGANPPIPEDQTTIMKKTFHAPEANHVCANRNIYKIMLKRW